MKKRRGPAFQGYPGSILPKKERFSPGLPLALLAVLLFAAAWGILSRLTASDAPLSSQPGMDSAEKTFSMPPSVGATVLPTVSPSAIPAPTEKPFDFALLVNESHPLPQDYDPSHFILLNGLETGLFTVKEPDTYADARAVDALMEMLAAAQADGIGPWQISEAYRSVEAQQAIWDERYEKYRTVNGLSEEKARQAVQRRVATPGCSEHHTGLAFDLTVPGQSFAGTPQSEWLNAHCYEYGFIVRYQAEKEGLTGITAEPWHVRYVGREPAAVMTRENLCLEEYAMKYR